MPEVDVKTEDGTQPHIEDNPTICDSMGGPGGPYAK